jgi:hypothetical protein
VDTWSAVVTATGSEDLGDLLGQQVVLLSVSTWLTRAVSIIAAARDLQHTAECRDRELPPMGFDELEAYAGAYFFGGCAK